MSPCKLVWVWLGLGLLCYSLEPQPCEAFFHPKKHTVQAAPAPRKPPVLIPYDTDPTQDSSNPLNLWQLEQQQVFRSPVVISPDQRSLAYTEVVFIPSARQTISTVYRVMLAPTGQAQAMPSTPPATVPVPPRRQRVRSTVGSIKTALHWSGSTPPFSHRPAYGAGPSSPRVSKIQAQWDRYNPDKSILSREQLIRVGWRRTQPFEFKTLTIVDWSATGQKLLVRQRTGGLHVGLLPSDIWVFDAQKGESRLYPELRRSLRQQFIALGDPLPEASPDVRIELNRANDRLTWDLEPLGWAAGSDHEVFVQVWEYKKASLADPAPKTQPISEFPARRFRGVWSFNIETKQVSPVRANPPWPQQGLPFVPSGLTVK